MPELPDVEAFREVLTSCARGRRITRIDVADSGVLHDVSPRQLKHRLEGRRFATPERHGKWLLARTHDGPTLMLHFGMTGRLVCCRDTDPADPHDRVVFTLDHDQLRFRDQRKLQGLWLAEDDTAADRIMGPQGPDALAIGRSEFDELLSGRRGRIKSALTDQSVLAGLGNLLADEILWRARLHPAHPAGGLTGEERRRLYNDMRRTLRAAVPEGHVPTTKSWLTGHRDDSEPTCPRCRGPLSRERISGRSTVWCPQCQPEPST